MENTITKRTRKRECEKKIRGPPLSCKIPSPARVCMQCQVNNIALLPIELDCMQNLLRFHDFPLVSSLPGEFHPPRTPSLPIPGAPGTPLGRFVESGAPSSGPLRDREIHTANASRPLHLPRHHVAHPPGPEPICCDPSCLHSYRINMRLDAGGLRAQRTSAR